MDRGAWWAAVHGVAKIRVRLGDFTFTFHFHALEKEMATHSSVLAWRIPGTEEPGRRPSMGSHRVGNDWSDLAARFLLALKFYVLSYELAQPKQSSNWVLEQIQNITKEFDSCYSNISLILINLLLKNVIYIFDKLGFLLLDIRFRHFCPSSHRHHQTTTGFRT